jgi:NDP-4-keto-2,6-dideoxyhexose 3-C-methyltransferase
MVRHLNGIVQRVKSIVPLEPGDLVLDIGSNDATTLGLYQRTDLDLVGIDACGEKFASYYPPHIRLIPDFFSAAKVREHLGDRQARVITSIAMFYDLEAPLDFVREVRDLLTNDGIWIAEQSYMPAMIANTSYDTICHEHLEYYALRQIHWMTERSGLKILDVVMTNANGGSFQIIAARKESPYPENTLRVERLLAEERTQGFDEMSVYDRFRDRVLSHRDELMHFLDDAGRRGAKIFGYGASTKGNVILQFCGLTTKHLPCFAEVNEEKFGCVTPGSNIPIVSEQEAHRSRPDYFLVMPWHFRDAIVTREAAYLARGGKLLFPLPAIEVVEGKRSDARAA